MSGSVNDKAADLSAKYREAKDAVMLLRQKERRGDWTSYQLMLDEAMGIAHDGLRNAWVMADSVRQLAKEAAALVAPQMWCFGSMRMFFDKRDDLVDWKLAQDLIWEKQNGSGFAVDRFKRVHELALHFYRGEWQDLHKDTPKEEGEARFYSRKRGPPHTGAIGGQDPEWRTDRLMRSVVYAANCHGYAVNETQKPEAIVLPLLQYSVPPGGLVVDCFAGSGTTGAVARKIGRRAILIEKREAQCRAIVQRLAQRDLLTANA